MRTGNATLACCFVLLFAACTTRAEPPADILFVGNSLTYFNDGLETHLRALMTAGGKAPGRLQSITAPSAPLRSHRASLERVLQQRDWDVVVLQGRSMEPFNVNMAAGFQDAVDEFTELVRAAGAEPVLYMTWARTDAPHQAAQLDAAYTAAGLRTGTRVAPVGLAFAHSTERNVIPLRVADGLHPTMAGTYLAACTIYAVVFGESPVGLTYTAGLVAGNARELQDVAWRTVLAYRNDAVAGLATVPASGSASALR